ncbi:hypothetical protein WDZ92_36210 [Nostoc sp. NIES-2111]
MHRSRRMDLDHSFSMSAGIFVFCAPGDGYEGTLAALGLVATYRRKHVGRGTANVSYWKNPSKRTGRSRISAGAWKSRTPQLSKMRPGQPNRGGGVIEAT